MARNLHPTYLIGLKDGVHLAGNSGTIITSYRRADKLQALASSMKQMHNLDEVWRINLYTQRMCEMDNQSFVSHIRATGKKLA